jgi:hypothetical protein
VLPRLGELRLHECDVACLDVFFGEGVRRAACGLADDLRKLAEPARTRPQTTRRSLPPRWLLASPDVRGGRHRPLTDTDADLEVARLACLDNSLTRARWPGWTASRSHPVGGVREGPSGSVARWLTCRVPRPVRWWLPIIPFSSERGLLAAYGSRVSPDEAVAEIPRTGG